MHRVTDGFQEKRESILDALMNIQSSFKSDPKASTRLKENLRKFVHKLGEFKAASERGRYPISRCFSERSERIARAAWDASMAIETGI
ncbi:hypothetical protein N7492_000646 [Penicillium capsulatum]|uniref:Uncharacterized protein n=1 Tax=Penicillium capsulatum TaxID=69766 RepID=A0A9W9ITX1_9EURO|nr:hypothetical protein N7492_000646 [Penicillium capsulatum]